MFRLEMLDASDGDCLLLSYGDAASPSHVLVDGGRAATARPLRARLRQISDRDGRIRLAVLTHLDADHIGGFLALAREGAWPVPIDEVWFNGPADDRAADAMGFRQAEEFSQALRRMGAAVNRSFGGRSVMVPPMGPLPVVTLEDGLSITLLSPDTSGLALLRREWRVWAEALDAGGEARADGEMVQAMGRRRAVGSPDLVELAARAEVEDSTVPNGSSIAFLAEHEGKRVLMGADAHPGLLEANVRRSCGVSDARLKVHLLKVPHHGSARNLTKSLLDALDCSRFAFSTDGTRHGHPDSETVARILTRVPGRKELIFNHFQPALPWNDVDLMRRFGYGVTVAPASRPISVEIT